MAIDKAVDSTQLDADITTVADAIRTKGGTSEQLSFPSGMAQAIAAIPSGGITPTGKINITDTNVTDVTQYATAQVVDADLIAANIKKDVNILGVVGSFEGGGGGSLPSVISKIDGGSFTMSSTMGGDDVPIAHSLGVLPKGVFVWCPDMIDSATSPINYALVYGLISFLTATDTATTTNYGYSIYIRRPTAGGVYSRVASLSTEASRDGWGNSTIFKFNENACRFIGGATYYWLAWA